MLVIDKNNDGVIIIPLRDKVEFYINDDYDFKFVNCLTDEQIDLTLTDTSDFPERYCEFVYTTTPFETSTIGFWNYFIEYDGVLVATGKMLLQSNGVPDITQYDGYDGTRIVYEI
jgi:hypothetical protein